MPTDFLHRPITFSCALLLLLVSLPAVVRAQHENEELGAIHGQGGVGADTVLYVKTRMAANFRREPHYTAELLSKIPAGLAVPVLGISDDYRYWMVQYDSVEGWIGRSATEQVPGLLSEVMRSQEAHSLEGMGSATYDEQRVAMERAGAITRIDSIGTSAHPFRLRAGSLPPNTAGGVDFFVRVLNYGGRNIRYLTLWAVPYNGVGDRQRGRIRGQSEVRLRLTGPIERNVEHEDFYDDGRPFYMKPFRVPGSEFLFEAAWYNSTITCAEIRRVQVEYMDGGSYTYVRELPKILASGFDNDCPYTD